MFPCLLLLVVASPLSCFLRFLRLPVPSPPCRSSRLRVYEIRTDFCSKDDHSVSKEFVKKGGTKSRWLQTDENKLGFIFLHTFSMPLGFTSLLNCVVNVCGRPGHVCLCILHCALPHLPFSATVAPNLHNRLLKTSTLDTQADNLHFLPEILVVFFALSSPVSFIACNQATRTQTYCSSETSHQTIVISSASIASQLWSLL